MMSKLGKELIQALEESKEKGFITLRPSPNVAALRKTLKLTQHQFAERYRINPETIKKWEQGKRRPDVISSSYLKCIANNPNLVKKWIK